MTMTPYTLGGASNAPATSTTLQFTLSHAVAAGDALVVGAASDTLAETVTTITDSQGNTYVQAASDYNQSDGVAVFYCLNAAPMTSGVDTITATFSGSTGSHTINGRGCNGIGTAVAVDVAITNDAASGTSPSSGASGTLRQSSEWAVAFLVNANGGGSPTSWTGGFTARDTQHATSNQYQTVADQTVSATTALTAGATIVSAKWAMVLVTLRAAPYLAGANSFSSGSTSTVVTIGAASGSQAVATGDLVLVICGVGSSSTAPSSVTDSQSQTYTLVASEKPGSGLSSYVYAAYNSHSLAASVDTVTVTWNSTSNNKLVSVVGCNGITTSAAFDQSAGASGTSAAPSSGATSALIAAGEPSVGVIIGGSASVSITPSASQVQLGSTLHVSGGVYMTVTQQSAPSAAGVTASGTLGTSAAWSALAAAFTQASGGDFTAGPAGVTSLSVTSPDPLTPGTVGVAYSYQLAATGGSPPYTWDLSSGSLPAGLTLTSGGGTSDFNYIGANCGPGTFGGGPTIAQLNATKAVIGPIGYVKYFYSAGGSGIYTGYLGGNVNGGSWSTADTGTPGYHPASITAAIPGVFILVNWAALMSQSAISAFVNSIPHTVAEVGFCFQSEPENAYSLSAGKQFVADWTDQANKIRAAQANTPVKLTLMTAHYMGHYQDGTLTNGSFIPPASVVDVYGIDLYDRFSYWGSSSNMGGLQAWTVWTGLVKGLGKPLAVAEYGISGAAKGMTAAQQNSRLQADWNYLKGAFGPGGSISQSPLYAWLYWETDGTATNQNNNIDQLMSSAAEATWAGIAATAGNKPAATTGTGGLISGTPTTAVSAQAFTVRATDSASATATKPTHLTIGASSALSETDTDPLAGATINNPYTVPLNASGGTIPYTFSVNSGSLPTGLAISGSTLTGTPTVAGTSTFVIRVTDNVAATANSPTLHITVATGLSVTTTALNPGQLGSFYTFTLAASGGTTPYQWAVASGALPDGLSLDPNTGIISGTPTVSGSFALSFTVTDSAPSPASATSVAMNLAVSTSTGLPAIGRQVFGGGAQDWGFTTSGGAVQISAAATWTFYNQSAGGTQYTDLQDMSNSPITSITTDSLGFAPQFQGPAGVFEMWADANGGAGPRHLVRPDTGPLLTILWTYLKTVTG